MKFLLHILILLSLVLAACSTELTELSEEDWEYSDPQSNELSPYPLIELDNELKKGEFGPVKSLTIIKDQKLVFENYYQNSDPEELFPLERGTQAIFYLLFDEILNEAEISFSDSVINLISGYEQYFDNIPQKDRITIYDLMNNRSGIWWNEWDFQFRANPNDADEMKLQQDWVDYVLSKRMIREPGQEFNYNSGHAILLSGILSQHLNGELFETYKSRLFEPLGIKDYQWSLTPSGRLNNVSGLKLKARDMAKIGMLMAQEGQWKNQGIYSERWSDILLFPPIVDNNYNYRMGWFKFGYFHPITRNNTTTASDFVFMWSEGGQFIFVSPKYQMTVVFTGDFEHGQESDYIFYLFNKYIVPSITESSLGT